MSDGLEIRTEVLDDGAWHVALAGSLSAFTFEDFEEATEQVFAQGATRLAIDMSGVSYISSAGAGALASTVERAWRAGGLVVLMGMKTQVSEVLELLGFFAEETQPFALAHSLQAARDVLARATKDRDAARDASR